MDRGRAGVVRHPGAEGDDLPGAFGDVDEGPRAQQAGSGALPPHEGLDPGHAALGQVHHRLVVQAQLVVRDPVPQGGAQLGDAWMLEAHRVGVPDDIVSVRMLGGSQGARGRREQVGHRRPGTHGQAHACGEAQAVTVHVERLAQVRDHRTAQLGDGGFRIRCVLDPDEDIWPPAPQVRLTGDGVEATRELAEDSGPGAGAVGLADHPQRVDLENCDAPSSAGRQGFGQARLKGAPGG